MTYTTPLESRFTKPLAKEQGQFPSTQAGRFQWHESTKLAILRGLLWGCPGIRLGVELTESKPWVMNVHVNTVIKIIAANNSDYAPAHAAIAA